MTLHQFGGGGLNRTLSCFDTCHFDAQQTIKPADIQHSHEPQKQQAYCCKEDPIYLFSLSFFHPLSLMLCTEEKKQQNQIKAQESEPVQNVQRCFFVCYWVINTMNNCISIHRYWPCPFKEDNQLIFSCF